ncbi:MAG: hypothetical protein KF780_03890 [Sphingomonas sp.]|nr:hypothetical protein [Sphingomonas sp.]
MAMMGDLLAAARRSAGDFQAGLEASDPEFARAVAAAAAHEGLTPGGFVRAAVADFSRLASEEDWATLMSSLRDSPDPGTLCLHAMVHWRMTAGGCSRHALPHTDHHRGAADERLATRTRA